LGPTGSSPWRVPKGWAGIAQQLAAAGETVLDVPASLAARARLLATGGGRKTDLADALHVAQVALHHPGLRRVVAGDQSCILRLLSERRDDLTHERPQVLNRLHGLLRDLLPGSAPVGLSAEKAAALLRTVRPDTATDACCRDLARDLLTDLRRIDGQLLIRGRVRPGVVHEIPPSALGSRD
jgi:transposase